MKVKVEINYSNYKPQYVYHPFINTAANKIFRFFRENGLIENKKYKEKDTLSFLICNDKKIRELQKKYRNIDSPTNELSFSYWDEPSSHIGEIVINWQEVIRDSEKSFEDRKISLLNFIIHAFLHIIHFTHETAKEKERMENLKMRIMDEVFGIKEL